MLRASAHGSIDEIIIEGGGRSNATNATRAAFVAVEFRLRTEHVDALIDDLKRAKREIIQRNKRLGRKVTQPDKK